MKLPSFKITKKAFRAWLAEQPADRSFRYGDNKGCMIFHFLKESGVPVYDVGGNDYRLTDSEEEKALIKLPEWLADLAARVRLHCTVAEVGEHIKEFGLERTL